MKGQPTLFEPIPSSVSLPSSQAPRRPETAETYGVEPSEVERRQSAKDRILACLQRQGSASNRQLNEIAFRYGARIMDLRREGWIITTHRGDGGMFVFRLIGRKAR